MKTFSGRLVAVFAAAVLSMGLARADEAAPAAFHVTAYLPDYRVERFDPAALAGLTDLVCFSIEPRESGELNVARLPPEMLGRLREACEKQGVRLSVALGGWERSSGFAKLAQDPQRRRRFVAELTRFCLDQKLAGADFDWEHPHDAAEEQAYADLLVDTKRSFRPHALIVTAAMAGWQNLPAAGFEALDRIHLMAYDHDGPRHSSFEQAKADVARMLARQGVAAAKIHLGVPFYGRSTRTRGRTATYAEILRGRKPAPDVDRIDEWDFNGIATIQAKTRFAREQKLGGMMIWELGQDTRDESSLLRAIGAVK